MPQISQNPILRETAHALIPVILLYALYVQFHGDFGPGGGFQAGVIFAVGIVFYGLTYGFERARAVVSQRTAEILACSGVLLYAGVGFVALLSGKNFLDYSALAQQPLSAQHLGIFFVELGVGITIAGTIIFIFFLFTNKAP